MKIVDVMASGQIKERAPVPQRKTQNQYGLKFPKEREIRLQTGWMIGSEYLWFGRFHERRHVAAHQYSRAVRGWAKSIGLETTAYGPHSIRRTKGTQIYKKTGNLRAVWLLLEHTKMDIIIRYLGVELEVALTISEAMEI